MGFLWVEVHADDVPNIATRLAELVTRSGSVGAQIERGAKAMKEAPYKETTYGFGGHAAAVVREIVGAMRLHAELVQPPGSTGWND